MANNGASIEPSIGIQAGGGPGGTGLHSILHIMTAMTINICPAINGGVRMEIRFLG